MKLKLYMDNYYKISGFMNEFIKMNIAVVTDSTSDIPANIAKNKNNCSTFKSRERPKHI